MVESPVTSVYATRSFVAGHEVDDGFKAYLTFANGLRALVDVSTNAYITLPKFYVQSATGTAVIEDWEMNGYMIRRTGAPEDDATPIQAGVGLTKTMAPRIMDYAAMASTTPPVEKLPLPEVNTDVMEFYRNALAASHGCLLYTSSMRSFICVLSPRWVFLMTGQVALASWESSGISSVRNNRSSQFRGRHEPEGQRAPNWQGPSGWRRCSSV